MKTHTHKILLALTGIAIASAIWFPIYQSKTHIVDMAIAGHWSQLVEIAAKECGERPWHVYGENTVFGMQFKCLEGK